MTKIYVFDTSSFVELKKLLKYADVLVSLWSNLDRLIAEKRLISAKKVFEDLKRYLPNPKVKSDDLMEWVKKNESLFQDENNQDFVNALKIIVNQYGTSWVDPDSQKNQSDQYVIAQAISMNKKLKRTLNAFDSKTEVIVVTEESQNLERLKIPKICHTYDIRCVNLHQFFQEEGWKF